MWAPFLPLDCWAPSPFWVSQVIIPTEGSPVHMRAYGSTGTIMGMASSRNTGFARYAAISALVALPGLMRKGNQRVVRAVWGALFVISVYALIIANGRTEIVAFLASLAIILAEEKAKRFVYFLVGSAPLLFWVCGGFIQTSFSISPGQAILTSP